MRVLALGVVLALAAAASAQPVSITDCGQTVGPGESGVVANDLTCPVGTGTFVVAVGNGGSLDLAGHALAGGRTGSRCERRCTISSTGTAGTISDSETGVGAGIAAVTDGGRLTISNVVLDNHSIAILTDFDHDRYQQISEIYKESSYLPPDSDGTPLVYTRVEGCLLLFCRSMRRVERLEVVKPRFIRATTVPERSDFKYSLSEWTFEPEGDGTRVTYLMEMEPNFWLPPFVGPWFLKRTLVKGAPAAIDQIELLAQQEERAATSSAAR